MQLHLKLPKYKKFIWEEPLTLELTPSNVTTSCYIPKVDGNSGPSFESKEMSFSTHTHVLKEKHLLYIIKMYK